MMRPLRVLLIEDSPSDAKLVVKELQRTGRDVESEQVETAEALGAALDAGTWDVIISDWSMPRFSASGALAILKARNLDLPFIIASGTIGEDAAVEAMRAGAHDYVLKDRLGRLGPAVEREVRECEVRVARRQAEEAHRESEVRFRRFSEAGIVGIITSDLDGRILEANDAYLRMHGYSREDFLRDGLRWDQLRVPEMRHLSDRAVEQLRTSGAASPWESEHLRQDGTHVSVLVGAAMLEHPRCIAFAVDLTERKRAEEARARAEEALRHTEEQFRQAQKMDAVGRLAGGVAHDFNNILSVILSYAQMMLDELKPGEDLRGDLEEIRTAGQRAAALTRQLLLFSRQQPLELQVLDLNETLSEMEKMLRRLLGEDVTFIASLAAQLGSVRADPGSIEQVVMNLVVNARDAMPTGGKLTIETANVVLDEAYAKGHLGVKAGPHVLLAVSDSGMGMDRDTLARIFEPFFTTKEKGKGTGLGLSTVFGIVRQCGGSVWVDSELGQGTTFKVYLPLAEGEVGESHQQVAPATLRGSEVILLVEDEEQVRTVAREILQRHGYRVLVAGNAGEALLLCENHPGTIDLVVSDVVMPGMSGPALARRLSVGRPGMKILCMSGYTDDAVVRHGALEAGMAFMQKPFTVETLARRVREVLGAKAG